jgi:hypothetical protein
MYQYKRTPLDEEEREAVNELGAVIKLDPRKKNDKFTPYLKMAIPKIVEK